MYTTISKISKAFEDFVSSHSILKEIHHATQDDVGKAKNFIYPLLYYNFSDVKVSSQRVVITLDAFFLDRLFKDGSNLINVQSNTLLSALDFYTWFYDHRALYNFDIQDDVESEAIVMGWEDNAAGWKMTLQINVFEARDETQIPFK
jgi:hypothetical protein